MLVSSVVVTALLGVALWAAGSLRPSSAVPALTMVVGFAVLLGAHVTAGRDRRCPDRIRDCYPCQGPGRFTYQVVGGDILIRHHGRPATTLRGDTATRFQGPPAQQGPLTQPLVHVNLPLLLMQPVVDTGSAQGAAHAVASDSATGQPETWLTIRAPSA